MTPTRTVPTTQDTNKKGLASAQPLAKSNGEKSPDLLWMNRDTYFIDIFQSPFWIILSRQVGIVVNRLDIRVLSQARIKGCSTQSQTSSCLFGCKHSFFLHSWDILIRLIILVDKINVKTYNTN